MTPRPPKAGQNATCRSVHASDPPPPAQPVHYLLEDWIEKDRKEREERRKKHSKRNKAAYQARKRKPCKPSS